MARANPASGSHPGNLLAAFFGATREGPDLPGAVPPRAGLRLLGGLLIAAMLHGARVWAVLASQPLAASRQVIDLIGASMAFLQHRRAFPLRGDARIAVSTCFLVALG
jgi:hypothetical protein